MFASTLKTQVEQSVCKRDYMKQKVRADKLFFMLVFLICTFGFYPHLGSTDINEKVLICGVCRNVAPTVPNTVKNIKKLGSKFADYKVIIYENNSEDSTAFLLKAWEKRSQKVILITETVDPRKLPSTREERIARARNIVLSKAKSLDFKKYKYLIMADLDFSGPWPIDEIISSLKQKRQWDCISANGLNRVGSEGKIMYWDRYAFRSKDYPLGPEVLGKTFWEDLQNGWFRVTQPNWVPVYSAFGGIAIYKTKTILKFSYSGVPTNDLAKYYEMILEAVSTDNAQLQKYSYLLKNQGLIVKGPFPIVFQPNLPCCEHVPLHASMALQGFNKMYVNPKMKMCYYPVDRS